jgi:hypothetical protein
MPKAMDSSRLRPADPDRWAGFPKINPGEPGENRQLHRRIDHVDPAASVDPGPSPPKQAGFDEQAKLAADRRAAESERLGDVCRMPNVLGNERDDLAPRRVRQQLDALRRASRHVETSSIGRVRQVASEAWRSRLRSGLTGRLPGPRSLRGSARGFDGRFGPSTRYFPITRTNSIPGMSRGVAPH